MSIKIDASKSFLFGHVIQLKKGLHLSKDAQPNETQHHISYISIFKQHCLQFDHYQVSIDYRSYISSIFALLYISLSFSYLSLVSYLPLCLPIFVSLSLCISLFVQLFLLCQCQILFCIFSNFLGGSSFCCVSFFLCFVFVYLSLCLSVCLFLFQQLLEEKKCLSVCRLSESLQQIK